MNNIDNQLFTFFKYISCFENKEVDILSLKILCDKYLLNNNYSDINTIDEYGNTLLHYAFKADDKNYIDLLVSKGANPFIYNNNGKNALTFTREHIFKFWDSFKDWNLDDSFVVNTQGYHTQLTEALFRNLVREKSYFTCPHDAQEFLHQNKLFNTQHLADILVYSPISLEESINYFLKNHDTPEKNTYLLNVLLNKYDKCMEKLSGLPIVEDFFNNHSFKLNAALLAKVSSFSFSVCMKNKIYDPFLEQLVKLIVNNGDCSKVFYKSRNMQGEITQYDYHTSFVESPYLNKYYTAYYLEKKLENKNSPKVKIKI